jgi:hypothetical protein
MLQIFKKSGPRRQAIKKGYLRDMQRKPFIAVNQSLGFQFPLAITPAAFDQFVALADTPAHRQLGLEARWRNILVVLMQTPHDDAASQALLEIDVIQQDGVLRTKTLKVDTGYDDTGEESFTFMLPEETDPVSSVS